VRLEQLWANSANRSAPLSSFVRSTDNWQLTTDNFFPFFPYIYGPKWPKWPTGEFLACVPAYFTPDRCIRNYSLTGCSVRIIAEKRTCPPHGVKVLRKQWLDTESNKLSKSRKDRTTIRGTTPRLFPGTLIIHKYILVSRGGSTFFANSDRPAGITGFSV
jgi:hypothetical protein